MSYELWASAREIAKTAVETGAGPESMRNTVNFLQNNGRGKKAADVVDYYCRLTGRQHICQQHPDAVGNGKGECRQCIANAGRYFTA